MSKMRMTGHLKILPKDKCLEVAKIVAEHSDTLSDAELLCWLPDNLFGTTQKIAFLNHNYIDVYDNDDYTTSWSIPIYFISAIFLQE